MTWEELYKKCPEYTDVIDEERAKGYNPDTIYDDIGYYELCKSDAKDMAEHPEDYGLVYWHGEWVTEEYRDAAADELGM